MKKFKQKPGKPLPNSRKVLRKQKRQEKKSKKHEHYSSKKKQALKNSSFTPGQFVKHPVEEMNKEKEKPKNSKQPTNPHDILNKERQKELKETNKLKSAMNKQRRKMLLEANDDEDKMIKKLEKQLGLNKSKNKNNYFADDGLDYLLEICDRATSEQIVAAEKHLADVEQGSDFEDDLAVVTGKKKQEKDKKKSKNKKDDEHGEELSDNGDESGDDDEDISDDDDIDDLSGEDNGDVDELSGEDNDEELSSEEIGSELDSEGDEDDDNEPPPKAKKTQDTKNNSKKSTTNKKDKNKNLNQNDELSDDIQNPFSDDEVSHLSGEDDDEIDEEVVDKKSDEKPDVWEDIYGRKRDKDGNVIKEEKGVYIPPHLRNKDSISDKELVQLKRQIKSVLNKISGANLHWACTSIESLYANNSRNSVNSALCALWLSACVTADVTPDRMCAEHAALIAVMHANVGNEIGAHFLQVLCKKFDEMLINPEPLADKKLDNLVACLAHLYNFKIFHANLVYDILNRLTEDLTEKNIECILVALRILGGVLRKDEPVALRDFIHDAQRRVGKLNDSTDKGSRMKFLLEVLMAVKNNNLNKIPNYDPTYTEQLRKNIRNIIRKGNYITPLNIKLEDLLKADERGKWWVVGSAWEGTGQSKAPDSTRPAAAVDAKLLELARAQRMNTDVRRSIFCVIMAAEDYMDAFEKLQQLSLRGDQEREVIHVLLACCLQEKRYNPYYAVLGQKLCDTHRKYQLSIQFAVWDKIKDLDSLSKQSMTNLAQFLIHLIINKGLTISVLKVIQFSDLSKTTVKFMRQILLAIIMNENFDSSIEVFHRIAVSQKLHLFRESLRLFIQHFLIRNAGKKNSVLSAEEMDTLKQRSMEVEKILTMHESKLRL